ncbi:MAG: acylphosphatase [Methanothrix sp.]|nr:acylphosphatase [Methanothrix sp.]
MTELHAASFRGMSPDPQSCESSRKASGLNNCPRYHTQIFFFPAGTYHLWMKLKITICGPKVHDVGYRPYLSELALSMALRGFEVFNDELNDQQSVVALIEGDETRVNRFRKMANSTKPPLASVERVLEEDYNGEIMPAWQFASIGTFSQMNKAIPLLLEMRDDIKEVRRNTDTIPLVLEEVRGIREDIQPGYASNFRQMQTDIRAIKDRLGML